MPGLTAAALNPAENASLIRVDSAGIHFSHPLVRAAVYHAAPFAERAAAHLKVADTLRGQPDRYAWHQAAAALEPDERVASLLEETAAQAQRRGGDAAAARALERAAELSPAKPDQARRLLAAGEVARHTGQSDWVQELAAQVLALTTDPELRITARYLSGWALIWSNRHTGALPALISVAEQAPSRVPVIAWNAIALAATVAYHSGSPASRQAVLATFNRMHEPPQPSADWAAGLRRPGFWTRPTSPSGCCGKTSAECAIAAAMGPSYQRCCGHTSTAGDGTRRSPPPARPPTQPPRTRWTRSPPPPTSPRRPCSPCAATTTHFDKALADPAGDTWPFQRAQLQLDYGEWLRRQRRINDAKPVLAAALETLRSLGATPWIRRAEAELRACGVTTQAAATTPGALADLTPQQRQIVILAGRGLTNGEIADRLFLSPRTVASHLYNSYPKLGNAGRHQLRDLIDQAADRPAAPPTSR